MRHSRVACCLTYQLMYYDVGYDALTALPPPAEPADARVINVPCGKYSDSCFLHRAHSSTCCMSTLPTRTYPVTNASAGSWKQPSVLSVPPLPAANAAPMALQHIIEFLSQRGPLSTSPQPTGGMALAQAAPVPQTPRWVGFFLSTLMHSRDGMYLWGRSAPRSRQAKPPSIAVCRTPCAPRSACASFASCLLGCRVPPSLGSVARRHENVTLLFLDIVG
jgi:hypothetical protein